MILTASDISNGVRFFLTPHLANPVAVSALQTIVQVSVNHLMCDLRFRSIVEVKADPFTEETSNVETLNMPPIVAVDYDTLTVETISDQTSLPPPLSDFLTLTKFGKTLLSNILKLIQSLDSGLASITIGIHSSNNVATVFFLTLVTKKDDGSDTLSMEIRRTVAERNVKHSLSEVNPDVKFDAEDFSADCNAKLIRQIVQTAQHEDIIIDSHLMLMRHRMLLARTTRRGVPNNILVHPNNFNTLLSMFTYQQNGLGHSLLQRQDGVNNVKLLSNLEVPEGKILIGYRGETPVDSRHFIDVIYHPLTGMVDYAIVDVGAPESLTPYWIIGDLQV